MILAARAGLHRAHRAPTLGRIIRREQEHRRDEDDEPQPGQRSGDAIAFMGDGIETEQRGEAEQRAAGLGIGGEEAEHQHEAQDAANIAGGPAGTESLPILFGGTSVGIIALLKTVANSTPTLAIA